MPKGLPFEHLGLGRESHSRTGMCTKIDCGNIICVRCAKYELLCEFLLQFPQTQFGNGRNFKLLILRQLQSRSSHQRRRISVPPRILFGYPARENLYGPQKTARKIKPFPFDAKAGLLPTRPLHAHLSLTSDMPASLVQNPADAFPHARRCARGPVEGKAPEIASLPPFLGQDSAQ